MVTTTSATCTVLPVTRTQSILVVIVFIRGQWKGSSRGGKSPLIDTKIVLNVIQLPVVIQGHRTRDSETERSELEGVLHSFKFTLSLPVAVVRCPVLISASPALPTRIFLPRASTHGDADVPRGLCSIVLGRQRDGRVSGVRVEHGLVRLCSVISCLAISITDSFIYMLICSSPYKDAFILAMRICLSFILIFGYHHLPPGLHVRTSLISLPLSSLASTVVAL